MHIHRDTKTYRNRQDRHRHTQTHSHREQRNTHRHSEAHTCMRARARKSQTHAQADTTGTQHTDRYMHIHKHRFYNHGTSKFCFNSCALMESLGSTKMLSTYYLYSLESHKTAMMTLHWESQISQLNTLSSWISTSNTNQYKKQENNVSGDKATAMCNP
jgi:hypothetical protein